VIEKIGLDVMVSEWTGPADLRRGPVHDPRTASPGERRNCVITGHRNIFGSPFLRLNELNVGDEIAIRTAAEVFWYTITSRGVCPADQLSQHLQPDAADLTLVTCDPPTRATRRLFVKAALAETGEDERVVELLDRIPDFVPDSRPSEDWPEGADIERMLREAAARAGDPIEQLGEEEALAEPPERPSEEPRPQAERPRRPRPRAPSRPARASRSRPPSPAPARERERAPARTEPPPEPTPPPETAPPRPAPPDPPPSEPVTALPRRPSTDESTTTGDE
jgi:LPXTG-site transpeptidase (sortase) family protein